MADLKDRVVLVTGGARGIGRGMVASFSAAGAKVMIGDLGVDATDEHWAYALASDDEVRTTIEQAAGEVRGVHLDVTDRKSCAAAVAATVDAFGKLDILVNNAGIVGSGSISQFSEEEWDRIFAVNTKGIFLMTQAALPALEQSDQAAVINTASIAGKKGHRNMSAYCGSKFAAIGITQSLAQELAPSGITVNAICPGMVGTAMWLEHLLPTNATEEAQKEEEFEAMMASTIPLGRSQTAQDMGDAAVYLATARNVTGVSLAVAGGFEMN